MTPPAVRRYGTDALLVDVAGPEEALALYRAARAHGVAARDVVPAAASVLFDGVADPDALAREIRAWPRVAPPRPDAVVEVPTRYDGADLADVARSWGMTRAEAVATHTALEFEVAFCGFSPGFAYCTGLPARLAVARLAEPRPRVPAGSVAVADRWTGVYPTASPGGWRLLGRTDLPLWTPGREQPATLAPGTRVRFVAR